MNSLRKVLRLALAIILSGTGLSPAARAGGSADDRFGVEKFGDEAIREFALKLNDELDRRQVNLAIVARSGRPREQLPRGISYTHVAFVVFEPVREPDGNVFHTYCVYNLYQEAPGNEDRSRLKQDFTYDFVAGTAEEDVAVCVPSPEMQRRLVRVIRSPAYASLHIPRYNVVANPWVDRFDNCVTHTLKVCVAAIYETDDHARIYKNIRAHFKPTRVRLSLFKAIGSHLVPPKELSREDMDPRGLQTASYDSLEAFLDGNGLVQEKFVVSMN